MEKRMRLFRRWRIALPRTKGGYTKGNWNPIAADYHNAIRDYRKNSEDRAIANRLAFADKQLDRMREQIVKKLRVDKEFLYEVSMLVDPRP